MPEQLDACRERGIKAVAVSAGYMKPAPREESVLGAMDRFAVVGFSAGVASLKEHRKIMGALKARNAALAQQLMQQHLAHGALPVEPAELVTMVASLAGRVG